MKLKRHQNRKVHQATQLPNAAVRRIRRHYAFETVVGSMLRGAVARAEEAARRVAEDLAQRNPTGHYRRAAIDGADVMIVGLYDIGGLQ